MTLVSATEAFDLAGVIPFYGGLSRELGGRGTVLQQAKGVHYPVLGLYGGADQGIPPEQIEQLNRALEEGGVEHQIVVYPGAPHSFFDRKQVEFAEQSADAWRRALAFIDAHS